MPVFSIVPRVIVWPYLALLIEVGPDRSVVGEGGNDVGGDLPEVINHSR